MCYLHSIRPEQKIYHWKPEGETRHCPHIVFAVRDAHAFYYQPGQGVINSVAKMETRPPTSVPMTRIRVADDESQVPDSSKWEEFRVRDFAQTCLAAKTQGRKKRKPERLYYYDDDLTATLASLKYQGDHKMKCNLLRFRTRLDF